MQNFRQSPPTYAYGLALLHFLIGGLYWTSAVKYGFKIAPPTLVGTMTGLVGSVNWIIAKGLSSYIAGLFISQIDLSISETFRYFSAYCAGLATLFYIIYVIFGRQLEQKRFTKVKAERDKIEEINNDKNSEKPTPFETFMVSKM